jgi:hypothetical protein
MTQMTLPIVKDAASEKQVAFINTLLDERDLDSIQVSSFRTMLLTMTKKQASATIDLLLRTPKRVEKVAGAGKSGIQEALSKAPKSKYAVPADELDIALTDTPLTGDLLFLEIKEYMGNLYMRRLTGSVGGFTRHKVDNADAVTLMNIISQDPYKYAKIFGQHYSCCGSCGAELTDPVSRELQLGPECRKKFGR